MALYKTMASFLILVVGLLWLSVDYAASTSDTPIYVTNEARSDLGFDVSADQTVAIRFSPLDDVTLSRIELWFMNNSRTELGQVTLSLRDDMELAEHSSEPGPHILEQWIFPMTHYGWKMSEISLESIMKPALSHSKRYWLVAESDAQALSNPVWTVAQAEGENMWNGYYGSYSVRNAAWSIGYTAIPTLRISGLLPSNTHAIVQTTRSNPEVSE